MPRGAPLCHSPWLAKDAVKVPGAWNQEEIRRMRPDYLAKKSRVETLGTVVGTGLSPALESLDVLFSCPAKIRF